MLQYWSMDKDSKKASKKDKSIPLNNKKSKIILTFIIVLFISNGFFMYKYTANYLETSSTITKLTQTKQSLSNKVVSLNNTIEKNSRDLANNYCERKEPCNGDKCLFKCHEAVVGYGYVSGYYFAQEGKGYDYWSGVEPTVWDVVCDTLIVEEGSVELVNDLIKAVVENGSKLNSVNEEGKLVLNISLDSLGEQEKSKIINSNIDNLVNLKIISSTPLPLMGGACCSIVDIVHVY